MLTVKIIKAADGTELLFEARELTKEPNGILVQTENDTEFYGPNGNRLTLDAAARTAAEQIIGGDAMAYVMNRFGATVATYRL